MVRLGERSEFNLNNRLGGWKVESGDTRNAKKRQGSHKDNLQPRLVGPETAQPEMVWA